MKDEVKETPFDLVGDVETWPPMLGEPLTLSMFGPYNTSVAPYCYCYTHVVHILLLLCPIESHYCYYYVITLLLLCRLVVEHHIVKLC